jgi:hypothetical protein
VPDWRLTTLKYYSCTCSFIKVSTAVIGGALKLLALVMLVADHTYTYNLDEYQFI